MTNVKISNGELWTRPFRSLQQGDYFVITNDQRYLYQKISETEAKRINDNSVYRKDEKLQCVRVKEITFNYILEKKNDYF